MADTIIVGRSGNSQYAVTDSARTITLSGLAWTPSIEDFAVILNKTQNKIYFAQAVDYMLCTISGLVITIDNAFPVLATGDELHIQLFPPNYGRDIDGVTLARLLNAPPRPNTDPIILVEEEDQTVDVINRYVLPFGDFLYSGVYYKLFADTADDQVVMTVWGTNDVDADDSADTGWADISTQVLPGGAASIDASNETLEGMFWPGTKPCLKYMIKLEYGQSSSGITENTSADVIIIKA